MSELNRKLARAFTDPNAVISRTITLGARTLSGPSGQIEKCVSTFADECKSRAEIMTINKIGLAMTVREPM